MNIILALLIVCGCAAVVLRYRPRGKSSRMIFVVMLVFAFAMLFTVHSFDSVWSWLVTLLDLSASAFGLFVFRSEAKEQARVRARAKKAARVRSARPDQPFTTAERIRRVSFDFTAQSAA